VRGHCVSNTTRVPVACERCAGRSDPAVPDDRRSTLRDLHAVRLTSPSRSRKEKDMIPDKSLVLTYPRKRECLVKLDAGVIDVEVEHRTERFDTQENSSTLLSLAATYRLACALAPGSH